MRNRAPNRCPDFGSEREHCRRIGRNFFWASLIPLLLGAVAVVSGLCVPNEVDGLKGLRAVFWFGGGMLLFVAALYVFAATLFYYFKKEDD